MKIVSDTGPLISIERLPESFQWIQEIHEHVIVPPSVSEELIAGGYEDIVDYTQDFGIESFLRVVSPPDGSPPELAHLHSGEADAIWLALNLDLELLIEEEEGRQVSDRLNVPYSGIAGQILIAVRENVLSRSAGRRQLDTLLNRGRINRKVYDTVRDNL